MAAAARVRELIDAGIAEGAFRRVSAVFVGEVTTATMRRITSGELGAATGLDDAEAYPELARLVVAAVRRPSVPARRTPLTEYPAQMEEDLQSLGEELISTAARVVRWAPRDAQGFTISLAAARLLARLLDNGPTRISDLAIAERCSQPTITNHVKRLESAGMVERAVDPRDGRAWMIALTERGRGELNLIRSSIGIGLEPYLAAISKRDLKAIREGLGAMQRLMSTERLPR